MLVLDELVANGLFGVGSARAKGRHAINDVGDEMKTVQVVHHHHVERRRGRAFFLEAAHMEILVVGAPIREPMNQPRITMIGEDDRFVGRERARRNLCRSIRADVLAAAEVSSNPPR